MWGKGLGEGFWIGECDSRANPIGLVFKVKVRGLLVNDSQLTQIVIRGLEAREPSLYRMAQGRLWIDRSSILASLASQSSFSPFYFF